jgi:hypothetical protein
MARRKQRVSIYSSRYYLAATCSSLQCNAYMKQMIEAMHIEVGPSKQVYARALCIASKHDKYAILDR